VRAAPHANERKAAVGALPYAHADVISTSPGLSSQFLTPNLHPLLPQHCLFYALRPNVPHPPSSATRAPIPSRRVDERSFWRNWFYRVHALKDAILTGSVHLNSIHHSDDKPPAPPSARPCAGITDEDEAARSEADARAADEMADRIRRELNFAFADEDAATAEGEGAPASADTAERPHEASPAAPADAPSGGLGLALAEAAPRLRGGETLASAPEAPETAGGARFDKYLEDVDFDDDYGCAELESEDDLDKLLDLGDDDDEA